MIINTLPPPPHQQTTKQRIEYIDALRGFCMILVVYGHIRFFSFEIKNSTMALFFLYFRMPLFFCISGFMCYKPLKEWTIRKIGLFMRRKVRQQLVSTLFFMVLFSYVFSKNLLQMFVSSDKSGYWFTYCLFIFFTFWIAYVLTAKILKLRESIFTDIILIVLAIGVYKFWELYPDWSPRGIRGILSVYHYNYFIFFVFGIFVKKYFAVFEKLLETRYFLGSVILFFIVCYIYNEYILDHPTKGLLISFSGLTLLFAYFRKYKETFSLNTKIGKFLNYIGRRTLDIYLIHYFILPYHLQKIGQLFEEYNNPSLEFAIGLALALIVIGLCCVVSSVFRMSPMLTWAVLGQKFPVSQKN